MPMHKKCSTFFVKTNYFPLKKKMKCSYEWIYNRMFGVIKYIIVCYYSFHFISFIITDFVLFMSSPLSLFFFSLTLFESLHQIVTHDLCFYANSIWKLFAMLLLINLMLVFSSLLFFLCVLRFLWLFIIVVIFCSILSFDTPWENWLSGKNSQ